ncbi:MAG: hypothetical protein KKA90_05090 [Nanoarchaeota archaeon]|nr:hypothetical protein [Nanoarchaeota archaeon]
MQLFRYKKALFGETTELQQLSSQIALLRNHVTTRMRLAEHLKAELG